MIKHPLWANLFKPTNEQQADIDDLWMATPLFAEIPQRHIKHITKSLSIRHYALNESVFSVGELGVGAALIINGSISIQSSGNKLATLKRGDLFGEVALATDETRTADAIAEEATDLVFFMKQDLQDLKKQNPATAAQFAINLAQVLAVRLRHANDYIEKVKAE